MTWEELVKKVAADPNAPRNYKSGRLSWEDGVLEVAASYGCGDDYVLAMMIEGHMYVSDPQDIQHVRQRRVVRDLTSYLDNNSHSYTTVRYQWLYKIRYRSVPRLRASIRGFEEKVERVKLISLSQELARSLSVFSPRVEEEIAKRRNEAKKKIAKLISLGARLSMLRDQDSFFNYTSVTYHNKATITEVAGTLFNLIDDPEVKADCLKVRMGGDK